ncbi:MAG TPA: hypothetical protein VK578_07940 [Edaphobacter sp.]|nr:hypothetical protein [Edaphobacter sp.]
MLPDNLRAEVLEIAEIAKACPPNLQERCFEMILTHYLDHQKIKKSSKSDHTPPDESDSSAGTIQTAPDDETPSGQNDDHKSQDIEMKDLHVKAKKFLEKQGTTLHDINQILYREGDEFLPLYEELKSTKIAECQTRIGLLQALTSGLKTGEFEFSGEDVRKECQDRKCYDMKNFSANFKNSSSLFEGFDKYDKSEPTIRLSEAGRKQLANLITELK